MTAQDPTMQDYDKLLESYRVRFRQTLREHPSLFALIDGTRTQEQLERLWGGSDYAAQLCIEEPGLLEELVRSGDLQRRYVDWRAQLQRCVEHVGLELSDPLERLKKQLRWFRKREYLRILWRDLNGDIDVLEITRELSLLADSCVAYAIVALTPLVQRLHGLPLDRNGQEQQLIVLAMGKYGAFELNLSSDIDLILAFPEDGETVVTPQFKQQAPRAQSSTVQQYFCKLGQLLIQALDTVTAEGFVFRMDLRLRPYGSAGLLALSLGAMEAYYLTQGRDWERFAMIKARAVTGDAGPVRELMQILRSFTYRRYLDFAAIAALRDLKGQIEQQVRRKGMSDNIKLGRGGIREIEFIVQALQLIFGGRHPHLQGNTLLGAMAGLVQQGCLPAADAAELEGGYRFLRRLEHAIQGLRDKQTHLYPADALDEYRCARAMGYASAQALRERLEDVRDLVAGHFAQLIADPADAREEAEDGELAQLWLGSPDGARAEDMLRARGFTDPGQLIGTLRHYRESRSFLMLDRTSRQRMDRFMPLLLARLQREDDPAFAFERVFPFVQAVAKRTAYLVLLMENAVALNQLVKLCVASSWVLELLCQHPVLLDELLHPLERPPQQDELSEALRRQLLRIPGDALEEQLSAICLFKQEQALTVAAAELSGTLPLMKVSDALSWIAEAVLREVLVLAWQHLTARYGLPVNADGHSGEPAFIIIAYGKLGGIELNYGSDLDLVFMHDAHPERETTGGGSARSIGSVAFYVQLGQKILSLLSTHTLSGKLYEIDLRLRPSGTSGALVSNLEAFQRYQERDAWTWEHQALVRTRVVAGSPRLAQRFEAIRDEILRVPRDPAVLARDIVSMRHKMRQQLGSKPGSHHFKLKQDSGGLVDIEFIVQYLALRHGPEHPGLRRWPDNMRLLDEAAACGVLGAEAAHALQAIYIEYRTLLHRHALENKNYDLDQDAYPEQRARVCAIWDSLFAGVEPGELSRGGEGHAPL